MILGCRLGSILKFSLFSITELNQKTQFPHGKHASGNWREPSSNARWWDVSFTFDILRYPKDPQKNVLQLGVTRSNSPKCCPNVSKTVVWYLRICKRTEFEGLLSRLMPRSNLKFCMFSYRTERNQTLRIHAVAAGEPEVAEVSTLFWTQKLRSCSQ